MDTDSKKVSFEDLPKDELIKKCKGLLNILQKAKQSKETLIEENNNLKEKLKSRDTDTEMLESLIQQKVQLITSLEEIKSQKKVLENKLKDCEYSLNTATDKIASLDNENEGRQRQIGRLVEENEQLLSRLDILEKEAASYSDNMQPQSEIFKEQHAELNSNYLTLKNDLGRLDEKYIQVVSLNKEVTDKNKVLLEKCETLSQNINSLEQSNQRNTELIGELQATNEEKSTKIVEFEQIIFELRQELEQQKKCALNDVQENNDLQDTNDKLKDKLKVFHSKLVKFASDLKLLKQEKNEVLQVFKDYIQQVKIWENQLKDFSFKVVNQFAVLMDDKLQVALEYDSLKIKFDSMEKENLDLSTQNTELSDSINLLKSEINSHQSEKLQFDNKALNEELNCAIKKIDQLKLELEALQCEKNLLNDKYHYVMDEMQLLKSSSENEIRILEDEVSKLKEKNQSISQEFDHQTSELQSLTTHNQALQKHIDDSQILLKQEESTVNALTVENNIASEKLGNLQETIFQMENKLAEELEQIVILKKENNELLIEMNEMNQVLKERGETISKQQQYCDELLKTIKMHESQSNKYLEQAKEKDCIIAKMDALKNSVLAEVSTDTVHKENEEIILLRNEISTLKEKLIQLDDCGYAESETLSTSTISKAEDLNRTRDLEGAWEERYGKLRSLALKLKGKIRETTEQLLKEQTEKNELQQKLISTHKTNQAMQTQIDLVQDELDKNKEELLNCSKQLDIAANNKSIHLKNLADNGELISTLKVQIEALSKDKTNTEAWKKQVSSKVQNLKRELDANLVMKKDMENQIKTLSNEVELKSKLLNEEIEKHNSTKKLLLESNNECKKQSVLNLELQDYERSLKEFTQKLDKKKESITKLKNQVDQLQNMVSSLKEQNRLFEERIQSDEKDLNSARGEVQTYKKRVADLEAIGFEKDEKMVNLTHILENSRAETEELSTQLSKVISDSQKLSDSLKCDKQLLHSQNSGLEMKLREMDDTIRIKNEELQEVLKEYEAYKVRAQSVLRSSQVRDVGLEEKLREEVVNLHAQIEVLSCELGELRISFEQLEDENAKLILDKDVIEGKWRDSENALEGQKQMYNLLSVKHQKKVEEHSEAITSLKVHGETLSQCYRQQLSEQESRHNKEIIELQSKIEKAMPISDTYSFTPPTMPREQGEGSECVDAPSNTKINTHNPLPLDKLLNDEMEHDVSFIRKQLQEHETKVNYLTSLLADTEQDLVKHVQMNKLLKEEIRRHQRSVEREKHADNLEYLKNIVYKFVTLSNGDERSRLVPVLNTILKLSPAETNQLNLVARGEAPGRGWSDYLPVWSSTKPH